MEEKVETKLVEASAAMIAAGTAGVGVCVQLPEPYRTPAIAACGTIAGIGASIIGFWHKFVNIRKQVIDENKSTQ